MSDFSNLCDREMNTGISILAFINKDSCLILLILTFMNGASPKSAIRLAISVYY